MTFEGNTEGVSGSDEERMKSVFGGRLKGEPPKSTSRFLTSSQTRDIAGIKVPTRPVEPDNCCMSGCVNCVWELYNDDLRDWKHQRREAVKAISGTSDIWPSDFDPPVRDLDIKNIPKSLYKKKEKLDKLKKQPTTNLFPKRSTPLPQAVMEAKKRNALKKAKSQEAEHVHEDALDTDDGEGWERVPVFFKAFAEFEKKKKLERDARERSKAAHKVQ
ncbi:unnamed protein product [Kluyveromyces dobzhanskii CBS 2104]|uniref:WGS project CCBQ000000000 data, contig 00006 n=1 Tax=Kluyveromyces dobzhanskii CBS 2104 TaxID=1427455 RepID=A0A0A8LAQ2_9SACH|nr:unnamed protein product [Kluyveromyces dobzhanskii CBS 2104]